MNKVLRDAQESTDMNKPWTLCKKSLYFFSSYLTQEDLSRFGREHINMEWLYEIKWPEMGVRFIAILDNVDTSSEDSNEFAAFTNLFNEWYPKTTSKKVKQVKRSKAMNGEHLGAPPFGYLKNPDNPKEWIVDEEAAPIVCRIFQMALEGKGCSAIATALWQDKIMTPSAYKNSRGIGVARLSEDPYCWEPSAVGAILDNSAYVGMTEGLKTLRVSFRSKKRIPSPKEHRAYVEDTPEPIIEKLVWEKVQELRQNKRRPAKTGATSIFSGLLYCADCG